MNTHIFNRFKTPITILWYAGLLLIVSVGVITGVSVILRGLWMTNLSDLVPWGLWITIDLSSIALSAGAFSLCAIVYLVGLKQYEPVARTATWIGIIGYSMAMMCLLMDIGRPDRFWHGFVFWNVHSVLWEVTMCVGLYFSVLLIETLPILGESAMMQRWFPWLGNRLSRVHHFAPVLAIFGLAFSLLHQSSLGATYGVIQGRPAWYRPNLSVLFIYSAVLAGISLTLLVSMLAARVSTHANVKDRLIERLSYAVAWGLLGYTYFRFWDAFAVNYTYQPGRSEALALLTTGQLAFTFWIGEVFLGMLVPLVILLNRSWRENPKIRMLALALIVVGVVAYRWNVNLVGQLVVLTYLPQEIIARYTSYSPSIIEILSGAGVVGFGVLAISLGVRFFGVVDHRKVHVQHAVVERAASKALPDAVMGD